MIGSDSGIVAQMARDLHDGPIQDVFATMIRLDMMARVAPADLAAELQMLSSLQSRVIKQMRELCQDPRGRRDLRSPSATISDVVADGVIALGFQPACTVDPVFDTIDNNELIRDIALVVRECLSNVARHSHATSVTLTLSVQESRVSLTITDNGIGLSLSAQRGNGLGNLRARAERHGGSCTFTVPPAGGTTVTWTAPLAHGVDQYGSTGGPDGSSWLKRTAAV